MPNLDLSIAKIMHGDTPVLRIMEGDTRVWPSGTDMVVDASLTNITSSIPLPASVAPNSSFTVTLTPEASHIINQISVTMGGVDITSSAYNDGVITIAEVTGDVVIIASALEVITFEDAAVKAICVENWGGNVIEGEITPAEAAAVTTLDSKFVDNTTITAFKELEYFTGLTTLNVTYASHNYTGDGQFKGCSSLQVIHFPSCSAWNYIGVCKNCIALTEVTFGDYTGSPDTMVNFSYAFSNALRASSIDIKLPSGMGRIMLNRAFLGTNGAATRNKINVLDLNGANFSNSSTYMRQPGFDYSLCSRIVGGLPGMSSSTTLLRGARELTRDALLEIISSLPTVTSATITIHNNALARLTEEDKALASAKGWSFAGASF